MLAWSAVCCEAALNLDANIPEAFAEQLRHQIFIDAAFLAERTVPRCSSLDGPGCLAAHASGTWSHMAGPHGMGVLPEGLWKDFGTEQPEDLDFNSGTGYHMLKAYQQELDVPGGFDPETLVKLRNSTRQGVLHFAGLEDERRVTLSYSRGLPNDVSATWDGRWISRGAHGGLDMLAAPDLEPEEEEYPVPMVVSSSVASAGGITSNRRLGSAAIAVVEQASSVAYVRFSKPVVLRALLARWFPGPGAPAAVVSGRLGLENVWATHLDPAGFGEDDWIDVSGGSLQLVDEIAFIGTKGLELGGMWVAENAERTSEIPVMFIEPSMNVSGSGGKAQFNLKRRLVPPAALPFLRTVNEALYSGLKLECDPELWALPHSHGAMSSFPTILSTEVSSMLTWPQEILENHQVLEHGWLPSVVAISEGAADAAASAFQYLSQSGPSLPHDLRRALVRDGPAIRSGLQAWISGVTSGWPRTLGAEAEEDFWQAKSAQGQVDLLTAAYLHRPAITGP